jgi:hypothetical protein
MAMLAVVVIYVALGFFVMLTWSHLSEAANNFASEAKQINREELTDAIQFQARVVQEAQHSESVASDTDSNEETWPEGTLACGAALAPSCEEMKTILPK